MDSCKFKNNKYEYLEDIDQVFIVVSQSLLNYYKDKNTGKGKITNLLYASVCGDEAHFHFHIIPRWSNDEERWRRSKKIFDKGYLLSFLSFLELEADENAKIQRAVNGWCETKQRSDIIENFKKDKTIKELKLIADEIANKRKQNIK